jgi:DNA-binding MarR family transcriptional regulator
VRDDEVFRLRKQVKSLYRRLQRERPVVDGLSFTAFQLLITVERAGGPIRPGELATELQMTNSNVAAGLRTLEAQDLVTLRDDPEDGRRSIVELTRAAGRLVAEIRQSYYTWLRGTIEAVLSKEEQVLLLKAGDLMQRLADHAEIKEGSKATLAIQARRAAAK